MEGSDRRGSRQLSQSYSASTPSRQYAGADRFRQPSQHHGSHQNSQTQQSPTSAPSIAASRPGSQGYNMAYSDASTFNNLQAGTATGLAYAATDYTDPSRPSAQQPSYGQYGVAGSTLMYGGAAAAANVGMAGTPGGSTASPYGDASETSGFGQPRNAAIEVLSNQFGGMQNYYDAGSASASGTAATGPTGANAAFSNLYGAAPGHSRQDSMTYPTEQAGFTAGGSAVVGYPATQSTQAVGSDLDNAYGQYQAELRRTFECVRDGRLTEAGQSLVQISEWLLGNAESLGLVRDDETMRDERLKLWNDFNTCWLATLQRQKDLTIEASQNPDILRPPTSLLEYDYMETMGKELVRLCDVMEKHGLVDYEMGVWEEDIVDLLTQCLDLLEDQQGGTGQGQVAAPTSRRR